MHYKIDQTETHIRVTVDGDLDAAMVQDMRASADDAANDRRNLIIDLSRVEFMDSAGVGLIVRAYKVRQSTKVPMAIVVGSAGQPREILRTTQIDRLIPFHASLEDALA
ncbi:STAS domain-containing protein [Thalassobaculum sp.]|uniref:STAS domain-containing protein n=1 Tax=Thalassobaculum sp. TaxID=2022740 RepID=UPI0032EBCE63